ncbi:hypothetical protein CRI94_01595 [Longibacter salinarum]|uniref:RHS repeat-associated core domain-containing protein n=1 Tax=Longibacter salinarum TaxID=1850348 RepID=A0A2A8D2Y7_9BACT|nr:RHS repeat-associated core domain-containing protein [Longibacter salinarum]PEN15008.1 hypothetical protein CRI94_01595 [Longibacter salinarum]
MNGYRYGARYYDVALARWAEMDPADEFHTPYTYVGGDPVNLVNPDGNASESPLDHIYFTLREDGSVGVEVVASSAAPTFHVVDASEGVPRKLDLSNRSDALLVGNIAQSSDALAGAIVRDGMEANDGQFVSNFVRAYQGAGNAQALDASIEYVKLMAEVYGTAATGGGYALGRRGAVAVGGKIGRLSAGANSVKQI